MKNTPAGPSPAHSCSTCGLRQLCLPAGLDAREIERLERLTLERPEVRKGASLFRSGDRFESVFAVRSGSFKTRLPAPAGGEQITGFQMTGDLLGLTGIAGGVLACDAVALEDAEICVINFDQLEALARECPALQRGLHRYMSQALVDDQVMRKLLAQARADERVAAFLVHLGQRQKVLGLSEDDLVLRMSREEIANLLGLRIETVSRCLSRLHDDGTIEVQGRRIKVLEREQLQRLAQGSPDGGTG